MTSCRQPTCSFFHLMATVSMIFDMLTSVKCAKAAIRTLCSELKSEARGNISQTARELNAVVDHGCVVSVIHDMAYERMLIASENLASVSAAQLSAVIQI